MTADTEMVGLGVRALTSGAWGFAAAPLWVEDPKAWDAVVPVARDAVRQAQVLATAGMSRPVELAPEPVVVGTWGTPVKIDAFQVPVEEKLVMLKYWNALAANVGAEFWGYPNYLMFAREERTLATSEGTLSSQTLYESGGETCIGFAGQAFGGGSPTTSLRGIRLAGKGWEIFEEADVPNQFEGLREELERKKEVARHGRPLTVGRYTVVCDGATMASVVESTIGVATQLDRALGYEANASGTSQISDPLSMVGNLKLASELVTVKGNRSVPGQLATAKWDEEGVAPQLVTLVHEGVLSDFQITRDQATWLAPYYQRIGRPVRSNGCAGAHDALSVTMQHMPNLSLEPAGVKVEIPDLIGTVKDGIFIENASVGNMDFQSRTGVIANGGDPTFFMRKIRNGRLAEMVTNTSLVFDTVELWNHITAIGGPATGGTVSRTHNNPWAGGRGWGGLDKGEPRQLTSHSISAVAAVIGNQPFIDLNRKA
jgi:TldD protein